MKRIASAVLLVLTACSPSASDPAGPAVAGVVSDVNGGAVEGAMVTARAPGSSVAYSVSTGPEGRYRIPLPRAGTWEVTTRGPGAATAPVQTVEPDSVSAFTLDVTLPASGPDWGDVPASAILSRLPDGAEKRSFILDCTGCHPFDRQTVLSRESEGLKPEAEWAEWAELMKANNQFMSPSRDPAETAAWLAAHLPEEPRGTELPPLDAPAAVGMEDGALITEYDLPIPPDLPHDLMVDVDGRVVVTGMFTHVMNVIDPASGAIETVPIPLENANPRALDIDDEGNWYVALGVPLSIAVRDRASGEWEIHEVGMYPHSVELDGSGGLWYNGHFSREPETIGRLDLVEKVARTIEVPSDVMPDGGITMQYGLRLGPDGTVWTTQLYGSRLIRYDPESGAFDLYDLPTPNSGPRRPDPDADGNIWIPEYSNNRLAKFDPRTETFTEYELPIPDALPYVVRVDRERNLVWIGTSAADALLRFDPRAETFTVFPLPTRGALVRHLDVDPRTGDVWGAYGASPTRTGNKIVRLQTR